MKSICVLVVLFSILVFSPALKAEDNSCWIVGSPQDDVWVIVYDADAEGNRGNVIWKGKVEAGKEQKIVSTDGHIRYEYTREQHQPYEGDKAVGCLQQRRIRVD